VKRDSNYRAAVEKLREKHSDKLESIFMAEYAIVMSDKSEDKDKNNAAKVCVSMLGMPRVGIEKPTPPKKGKAELKAEAKPTPEELEIIEARLNA
jgi:hypothetical protein